MPDITMCSGFECPLKDTCVRFTSKPSEFWQAYFTDTPYDSLIERCDFYYGEEENNISIGGGHYGDAN